MSPQIKCLHQDQHGCKDLIFLEIMGRLEILPDDSEEISLFCRLSVTYFSSEKFDLLQVS